MGLGCPLGQLVPWNEPFLSGPSASRSDVGLCSVQGLSSVHLGLAGPGTCGCIPTGTGHTCSLGWRGPGPSCSFRCVCPVLGHQHRSVPAHCRERGTVRLAPQSSSLTHTHPASRARPGCFWLLTCVPAGPTATPWATPGCAGAPAPPWLQEKGKLLWEESPGKSAGTPENNGPQSWVHKV